MQSLSSECTLLVFLIAPSSTYHWVRGAFNTEVLQGLFPSLKSGCFLNTP